MPKKIKLNGPVIGDGSTWLYDWFGMPYISAGRVSRELDDARGDDVELYINSPGGSVFAGSEVYTVLKEYPGKVTAKITGVAASAASYIALAAEEIRMSPLALFMIHNAAISTDGDKRAHSSRKDLLEGVDESLISVYMKKSGKTRDELAELMNNETWMNAQKAVELGFADGILFEDEITQVEVTNSISGEIPPQIEEKLRDFLVNTILKDGNVDLSAIMPQADLTQIMNSIDTPNQQQKNEEQSKEEAQPMKLEELKAQYPDLYNEIVALGVTQERNRITELNALATAPGATEIVAKAIEDGKTAGETAMAIVKASAERVANVGQRRTKDAENSNVNKVEPDEAPEKKDPQAVYDAEAAALTEEIKNLRGGK